MRTNVIEVTDRKSLIKQQILMYKTAVYTLVNGGITHQKQQISEKGDIIRSMTLPKFHVLLSNITFFLIFAVFDV